MSSKSTTTTPPSTKPPSPTDSRGDSKPKEPRRRRNQLSCAECRRLKLRCDRVFPCESCKKRGCAAICPDGALTTKGTRFVLANTEEYHTKISDMSERIRELEMALGALHPDVPHPLLRQDLLQIKVPIELNNKIDPNSFSDTQTIKQSPRLDDNLHLQDASLPVLLNASGTLKMGPNGRSLFFGQCANAEFFTKEWDIDGYDDGSSALEAFPLELRCISHAFPSGCDYRDVHLVQKILDFLPPMAELDRLVDLYYAHSAWFYEPCPKNLFYESLEQVLEYRYKPAEIDLHRLALVFAITAHGCSVDLEQKP